MAKASRRSKKHDRFEKRFLPQSPVDTRVVGAIGAIGSIALGAGVFGQFGGALTGKEMEPVAWAPWILAGGAVILGAAIWIGTSGDPAIRVGSAGVGEEKGSALRRIPWHQIESVKYSADIDGVVVTGKDEGGQDLTIKIRVKSAPQAAAWVVDEAERRVEKVVDLGDAREKIPPAAKNAGEGVPPPPLQIVGKRCAASNKLIAFEPDGRVCPQCERVFHKHSVPKRCPCGADLSHLREKAAKAAEG
jgi:hypothetical protein